MCPPQPTPSPLPLASSRDGLSAAGREPAVEVPYEDSIWPSFGRLRTAARIAGLHLALGEPRTTPAGERLSLGEVDRETAQALADTIADTPPTPGTAVTHQTDMEEVADRLRATVRSVGLDLRPGTPRITTGGERLPLGDADHTTVTRLADLLEAGLAGLYETADELRTALLAHGIHAKSLTPNEGAIQLGEIPIPHGDLLLRLLADNDKSAVTDPDDQRAGEHLAGRITTAVKTVTDGGFLDCAYTPYCRRCGEEAAVILSGLRPVFAWRLTAHLKGATT